MLSKLRQTIAQKVICTFTHRENSEKREIFPSELRCPVALSGDILRYDRQRHSAVRADNHLLLTASA